VGYLLAAVIVIAATVWGHVLRFDGFGSTRGFLVALMLTAAGGFLGFVLAASTRPRPR
jgi:hypothetical protein